MHNLKRGAIALSLAGAALAAQADIVTYDFSVTVSTFPGSGPEAGNTFSGTFSYNTDSVVANTVVTGADLLTDLNFVFRGTPFDETSANTGWLSFDSGGLLDGFLFGNNCVSGDCTVAIGQNQWSLSDTTLSYSDASDLGPFHSGGVTFGLQTGGGTGIPEPATITLVIAAALAGSASRRRA